jgi:hypothetical protein
MKSTSPFSRLVRSPASSPAFSITGSAGILDVYAHRVGDDVSKRGFAEAGRSAQQNVLEHVAAPLRRFHHQFKPLAHFHLAGELAERWRAQRNLESGIWFRRFHAKQ